MCLAILAIIAFQFGYEVYRQPKTALQMNYTNVPIVDESQLWKPAILATSTPLQSFPVNQPVQKVPQIQCLTFMDGQHCQ